jgi:hypothetical protein
MIDFRAHPEVDFAIESEMIVAKNLRKLKAVWSYEAQQDLRFQHDISLPAMWEEIFREVSEDPHYTAWLSGYDPCQEDPNKHDIEKFEWQKEGF